MTHKLSTYFTFIAAIAVAVMFLYLLESRQAEASAFPGLSATIATTSNITVGTSVTAAAIATSSCQARIISTSASPVMLTFSDYAAQTPTGSFGHLQGASTTVAYDSGLYGCGAVKIYSFTTQLITVSDVR